MSPTLSDAEVTSMRQDVRDTALPMFATIERYTAGAADGYGQPSAGAWAVIDDGVECFYSAGNAQLSGGEHGGIITSVGHPAQVTLPAGTSITEQDRITVRDTDGNSLGPLNVTRVRARLSGIEAEVSEVTS